MPFTVKLPENDAADPSHVPPINDDKPFWNQVRESTFRPPSRTSMMIIPSGTSRSK